MDTQSLRAEKRALRARIRTRLTTLSPKIRQTASARITAALTSSAEWRGATTICAFVGTESEVNTDAICRAALAEGKRLALPRVTDAEIEFFVITEWPFDAVVSSFGIVEPGPDAPRLRLTGPSAEACGEAGSPPERLLVVTPGLAFDRHGARLGQGGGYYDRWFARMETVSGVEWIAVAIAFGIQIVEKVPSETWDRSVHALVSDGEGWLTIPGGAGSSQNGQTR
ncbi:MAG: 5-formyltetrahydrofolate cyclo-ligase [Spirochaetaceae bacterium]|nr:MAG: 5-formyltetrahydrofolate cyclo-ligase [Spirochaetaceae bacterium]